MRPECNSSAATARRGGYGLARHLVIESLPQPVAGAAAGYLRRGLLPVEMNAAGIV